jgi:uncharacterized membrane protein (UPF0182 family)
MRISKRFGHPSDGAAHHRQTKHSDQRHNRQPNRPGKLWRWVSILIGIVLLLDLLTVLLAEGFWFGEVHYTQVFLTRLVTQTGIGLVAFIVSLSVLWLNLRIAQQQTWPRPDPDAQPPAGSVRLSRLLPLVMLISIMIAVSLNYYGQVAASHWQPNLSLRSANLSVPLTFDSQALWALLQTWRTQPWQPALLTGLIIALLLYPQLVLRMLSVLLSLGFVLVLSEHWDKLLLALHRVPFNQTEPLFQTDIGFYVFSLPFWELLEFWLLGLVGLTFLSVSLVYLLSGNSLSQGYFPGFSRPQSRHLYSLAGWLMLVIGLEHWLNRYRLLYSPAGATYGASYTNIAVDLPVYTLLSLLSLILGIWLLLRGLGFGKRRKSVAPFSSPLLLLSLYLLTVLLLTVPLPLAIQQFVVQPNELQLEQPYIQRTIGLTRQAFKLDQTNVQTFNPDNSLTLEALDRNSSTVENIRLWDQRPLLETNRQLQRIRSYYEFPGADIDRYSLVSKAGEPIQQQVLIAARELDYDAVPAAAQTWVNQHLIYTHGYGFTVSPVNTAAEGGLPDYLISGIETITVDPRARNSIPIGRPRIYYGEITNTYVMTQTQVQELDFPSGSDNAYNTYMGRGGVSLGSFAQRVLYAIYLRDWRIVFSDDFTAQTKLLFRRNITERVKAIAPFLRFDSDPYLVVVDTGNKQWQRGYRQINNQVNQQTINPTDNQTEPDESYLYWMIDAYTTSDRYPYADPMGADFNYIRNSVKVVIDAYHGSVNFYVADAQDPIVQSWSQTFPGMLQPLEQMPVALRQHLRYPQDFLQAQSNHLMTYHMTDPVVFYNREDQWRAPNEIYGSEQQIVQPYYLIMKLPIGSSEEFILLQPFTPASRNNLIAWLAARSDGEQYGKILLYTFPKQKLVFGPEQIEARINQDPVISERISLWNRQGSRAAQGNLLVIPIETSLLYVEPLYLVAEQNQLPTLVRVVVVYGNRVAMAETLNGALNAIFTAPSSPSQTILRTTEPLTP